MKPEKREERLGEWLAREARARDADAKQKAAEQLADIYRDRQEAVR